MNYLTNYYKNLSEQLQEKINYLEKLLNEGRVVRDPKTGKDILIRDPSMMPRNSPFTPKPGEPKPEPFTPIKPGWLPKPEPVKRKPEHIGPGEPEPKPIKPGLLPKPEPGKRKPEPIRPGEPEPKPIKPGSRPFFIPGKPKPSPMRPFDPGMLPQPGDRFYKELPPEPEPGKFDPRKLPSWWDADEWPRRIE